MASKLPPDKLNQLSECVLHRVIPENQAKNDAKLHNLDFSKSAWKIGSAESDAIIGNRDVVSARTTNTRFYSKQIWI